MGKTITLTDAEAYEMLFCLEDVAEQIQDRIDDFESWDDIPIKAEKLKYQNGRLALIRLLIEKVKP